MNDSIDITIIGCGVSGLTCGIRLLEEGYSVTIVADKLPPDITSNVAAAYWYPYKVSPKDKVLKWAEYSYNKFFELNQVRGTGVSITELVKLFDHKEEDPFWRNAIHKFRRATRDELPHGYIDAYISEIPIIETPIYMKYLVNRLGELGGRINKLQHKLSSVDELCSANGVVINCTGLGSYDLCHDERMFPIRGQLVRTTNPGLKRIFSDEEGPLGLCYIVPRSTDCILGGTAQENNWDLDVDEETASEILRKCRELEPKLDNVEILEHKVGLRPGRDEVRLETEILNGNCLVIHNYGHGGAGFTLSWGCAEDVLQIVKSL